MKILYGFIFLIFLILPYILNILKIILRDKGLMYFVLKNVGNKAAKNIKIEFNEEISYFNNRLKDK